MSATHAVWQRTRTPLLWIGGFLLFALFVILNKDFSTFLNYFALGLPQGAIIALIAVGYSMVYGIIQLINFAHGEVFMFSTYFTLMLLVPARASGNLGLLIICIGIGLLTICAMWVALGAFLSSKAARAGIAAGLGVLVAGGTHFLIPRVGGHAALPFFLAVVLAIFYSCCLGVSMDVLAYKPLRNSPRLIPLITAIGISLFLQNVAQAIWGSASRDFPAAAKPAFLTGKQFTIVQWQDSAGVERVLRTTLLDLLIIGFAVVLMVGLQLFIHRTRTGRAMRACAQDRVTASLMGVHVDRVVALAFALGAALAAIAAPLYVLRGTFVYPTMGYIVGILAFSSAVLGGIGNITGAMLGGLIIGIIYNFVPLFDSFDTFRIFGVLQRWGWVSSEGWNRFASDVGRPGQYQLGVAYAFMILVIVFKPTGLLGRASAKRA